MQLSLLAAIPSVVSIIISASLVEQRLKSLDNTGLMIVMSIVIFFFTLASYVWAIWGSIAIYRFALNPQEYPTSWQYFSASGRWALSYFTTAILVALVIAAIAIIPVLIILGATASIVTGQLLTDPVLNGIGIFTIVVGFGAALYTSVRLMFAPLLVITEQLANSSAMKRSRELVKGYWWQIAVRGLVFGLTLLLAFIPVAVIIGIVLFNTTGNSAAAAASTVSDNIVTDIGQLLFTLVATPLGFIFITSLYRNLAAVKAPAPQTGQLSGPNQP